MRKIIFIFSILILHGQLINAAEISEATQECIDCHQSYTPGIVADWQKSLHAQVSPSEGLVKSELQKRVSSTEIPEQLLNYAVGCAECHMMNPDTHGDSFDHNDYNIHIIVTPDDCAVCHGVEAEQYQDNIMSHAYGNLMNNELYRSLMGSINGVHRYEDFKITSDKDSDIENSQSCLYCHGTEVKVEGMMTRETDLGEMDFPKLSGWPNQGVGRINPDGSKGACSACHTRHQFSVETARKPYTCAECHKGPDVPAYGVYMASKHGNIFSSHNKDWDFKTIPWMVGEHFTAPTCAACHISLLVNSDEEVIVERTHSMNDRLDKRIFGLIYAHPYPKDPNTTNIINKAGLPLPTELTGEPVMEFLIDESEQAKRLANMQSVCKSCHSSQWTENHFAGLDHTIEISDEMTLTATKILLEAWGSGYAEGLSNGKSVFDEDIEKMWVKQWLFYANSCRFASAMGGADYGVFEHGRWNLSENVQHMLDWLTIRKK